MGVQEKVRHGGAILMEESLQKVSGKAVMHPGDNHHLLSTYCMLGPVPHHDQFLSLENGSHNSTSFVRVVVSS